MRGRALLLVHLSSLVERLTPACSLAKAKVGLELAGRTGSAEQPVGDTGRYEPRRWTRSSPPSSSGALNEPDPPQGIAQLTTRCGAAFVLSPTA